jgi:hypothetical protein
MATVTPKGTRKTTAKDSAWVTRSGRVMTDDDAAALAASLEADDFDPGPMRKRPVGRPGLSRRASGGASPRVSVRVEAQAYEALKARADAEHRTVSDLAREAIQAFVGK